MTFIDDKNDYVIIHQRDINILKPKQRKFFCHKWGFSAICEVRLNVVADRKHRLSSKCLRSHSRSSLITNWRGLRGLYSLLFSQKTKFAIKKRAKFTCRAKYSSIFSLHPSFFFQYFSIVPLIFLTNYFFVCLGFSHIITRFDQLQLYPVQLSSICHRILIALHSYYRTYVICHIITTNKTIDICLQSCVNVL